MATDIERLQVLIEANTKAYENAMAKVEQRTQQALARVERQYKDSGDRVDSFLSKIGARLFAGGFLVAGGKAVSMFKNMVSGLGDIADMAERAGVSTDFIQAVGFQVEQAGGSMEDAARAAAKFGKELGDVNVHQSYLGRLLAANGINLKSFGNDGAAAFEAFAKVVANARSPQEALNMVSGVFGDRVGPKMISTLQEIGNVGLPAFIQKMKEAGIVLDENLIKKGDQIDDRWNELLRSMGNTFKTFILETIDEWKLLLQMFHDVPEVPVASGRPRITVTKGPPSKNVSGSFKDDDFKNRINAIEDEIERMEREAEVINQTTAAREAAAVAIRLEQAARQANAEAGKTDVSVTAEQRAEIDRVVESYGRMAAALENARGPMASFGREAANVKVQMEDAIVSGLKGFEDALIGVIQGTKDAKTAFRDMANAIIADLLRIAIRSQITGPLANLFSGIFGGFGGGGGAANVPLPPVRPAMTNMAMAAGGGGAPRVQVNVIEGAGGDRVKQKQRTNSRGDTIVDVLTKATNNIISDGKADSSLSSRFAARPTPMLRA